MLNKAIKEHMKPSRYRSEDLSGKKAKIITEDKQEKGSVSLNFKMHNASCMLIYGSGNRMARLLNS